MSVPPVLECLDIAFERDYMPIFSGLSFTLQCGQILRVSGANGSGKTTLLRILATSLITSAGRVLWNGSDLDGRRAEYRFDMLYLGHQPGVKAALTPRENLAWLRPLHPKAGQDISRALTAVGLAGLEDVPCHTLSAGQLRRVALARLHLSDATLWILDEPFTAIDQDGVARLETLVQAHAQRGGAVVFTTHQNPRMKNLCQLDMEHYGAS